MENKKVVVTGASGSIGEALVTALAERSVPVILACRNREKGEAVRRRVTTAIPGAQLELRELDLASIASIERFAAALRTEGEPLGGLLNNAGVMNRNYAVTESGFETTLGVNYIGVYLLSRRLLPLLRPGGAIVNTTSLTRKMGRVDRTLFRRDPARYSQLGWYADSKLALLLFTAELAERTAARCRINAADPGVVDSNMITMNRWFDPLADRLFRPFIKTPRQGARPALNALCGERTGCLFHGSKSAPISRMVANHPDREWLWEETERILGERGVTGL